MLTSSFIQCCNKDVILYSGASVSELIRAICSFISIDIKYERIGFLLFSLIYDWLYIDWNREMILETEMQIARKIKPVKKFVVFGFLKQIHKHMNVMFSTE